MNQTNLGKLASIAVAALFLGSISVGIARESDPPETDGYIQPHLAADGVTSDDVALAKAAEACNAAGTRLVLPAGKILLTGAATIVLNHCAMVGVGAPGDAKTGNYGTTILLTSETVPPFQLETGWLISGINFYWPNQTSGEAPYPPLFSDGGIGRGFNHGVIDNIVIVNAYDGMTTTPGGGSGDVKISNSTMWAYHYLFNLTNTGDSWAFSNNRFTPGPLLSGCGFAPECEQAVNAANRVNALFHVTAGGTVTLVVGSMETFSWRYGILIDKGALLGGSIFDVAWDGVGTLIDSSSGGRYAFQNNFTGSMSECGIVVYGGTSPSDATPCFNLGPGSGLFIHDFRTDGSNGSWLLGAGGNTVVINNVTIGSIGSANDGKDYYIVDLAAPTNTLIVRNSQLRGFPSSSHAHGINIGTNTMGNTVIQDCVFNSLNDAIVGVTNNQVMVTGNTSFNTSTGHSVNLRGTGKMVYSENFWDVPPTALLPIVSN